MPGGAADQGGKPQLTVTGTGVRASAQGDMSAAYFTVENDGEKPVRLTAVRADVAGAVELHESVQEGTTIRMQPVDAVEIPVGGHVEFAPGGYQVMLMDLKQGLHPADQLDLTLVFDDGQDVNVSAEVRDAAGSEHSEHEHSEAPEGH